MTRPTNIIAGNSYDWKESDVNHPSADGWTATATITNQKKTITIDATNGDGFEFILGSTLSKDLPEGDYHVFILATKGDERKTIKQFNACVSPDPTGGSFDHRTKNERYLAAIEAVIGRSASRSQKSIVIDNQPLSFRDASELLVLHDRFKRYVAEEKRLRKNGGRRVIRRATTRLR